MNLAITKLRKVIPHVLVIAFLCTLGDFTFIKRLLTKVEDIVEFQGETIDLGNMENDYEVVDLRTANTKTFKKINDSYEMVMYSEDIHYLLDGKYVEIDNSLVNDGNYLVNKANRYQVKFPKSIDENTRTELKYNNHLLQWKYHGIKPVNTFSSEAANQLQYKNVFQNVNLQYILKNNSIKENLILAKYIPNFQFSYSLYTDLRIERVGDRLELYNDEYQLIYTINEYFMYDAKNNVKYDIDFSVSQKNHNEYFITVSPSNDFLKNATYPVVIDPEIVINNMEIYEFHKTL